MTRITDDAIDLAVLRLFRECNGGGLASRVLYGQLERRWRATGLRRQDLAAAVARLEMASCLRVIRETTPGPDIELLVAGYRRLIPTLLSAPEWLQSLRARAQLWTAQLRSHARHRGGTDRRHDD